ncbi:MAG: hypothetical protein JWP09_200 [Candidatus Taylorbacteria bacterium]|nr:hypothetical protein [Candidatus Taylorbacteria bacterium]
MEDRHFYGQPQPPHDSEGEEVQENYEMMEALDRVANYRENWSNLFQQRLLSEETVNKYMANLTAKHLYLADEKRKEELKQSYRERVMKVFSHTEIGKAETYKHQATLSPYNSRGGGIGSFESTPIVFADAEQSNGRPMDHFHKSITEAHEQAHGVLDDMYVADNIRQELTSFFYANYILKFKDPLSAVFETVARITQLKNYFGMKGGEPFTKYHLEYAKKYYVRDVGFGIDNITYMFQGLKPEKEQEFVDLINRIAC